MRDLTKLPWDEVKNIPMHPAMARQLAWIELARRFVSAIKGCELFGSKHEAPTDSKL